MISDIESHVIYISFRIWVYYCYI